MEITNAEYQDSALTSIVQNLKKNDKFVDYLAPIVSATENKKKDQDNNCLNKQTIMKNNVCSQSEEEKENLLNLIFVPGLVVDAIVIENQPNYLTLRINKILTISQDFEDIKLSSKRLKSLKKKLKKQPISYNDLLQETRKIGIDGILSKQEIANNSHFSYMLNGDDLAIGEHLYCVVLDDLIQCNGETYLSLSLRNERLCGKVQVYLKHVMDNYEGEIELNNIEDDPQIQGYSFGVPIISSKPKFLTKPIDDILQKSLLSELDSLDYNLITNITRQCNNPDIYFELLKKLKINQHETLLEYSNSMFCKDALSYYKQRKSQNTTWANENYKKGCEHFEKGIYEQAILYFNQAQEYDSNLETAYVNKAQIYYIQGKYKKVMVEQNKCIEINDQNTNANNLLIRVMDKMKQNTVGVGNVELELKKKDNKNKDDLIFN